MAIFCDILLTELVTNEDLVWDENYNDKYLLKLSNESINEILSKRNLSLIHI